MNASFVSFRLSLIGSVLILGCMSPESDVQPVPTAKAKPIGVVNDPLVAGARHPAESKERLIGGIKFQIPGDWDEGTANAAIIAEYRLPGTAGAARLTFSTAGGGTEANIERWKQQFHRGPNDPEPKESSITAAGKPATLIEAHGSFSDMFSGGGTKPNWQLLGVAIPIDADHNYFVKLTGPKETVAARQDEFLRFVETARFE